MLQIHQVAKLLCFISHPGFDFEGISKLFINIITSYLKGGFCEQQQKKVIFFHLLNKILSVQ